MLRKLIRDTDIGGRGVGYREGMVIAWTSAGTPALHL